MALYKYVSFSNLKHLLDGTIRFTQPKAFNDPFELLPEMYLTGKINELSIDVTTPRRDGEPARLEDSFESNYCNDIAAREVLNSKGRDRTLTTENKRLYVIGNFSR